MTATKHPKRCVYVSTDFCAIDGEAKSMGNLSTLDNLLSRIAPMFAGEGVILVDDRAAKALGLPATPDEAATAPTTIPGAGGWTFSVAKKYKDWITCRHGDTVVYVGVVPLIDGDVNDGCALAADLPTDMAMAFKGWHDLTGRAWQGKPSWSGLSVLRSTMPAAGMRNAPTYKPKLHAEGAQESPLLGEQWSREYDGPASRWDKTRAYVAAASVVKVAPWTLRKGPTAFDPELAGWWRVELGAWSCETMPNPAGYGDSLRWVTTPTLVLLDELRESGRPFVDYEITESLVGEGKHLLKGWAEKMRDAYDGSALLDDENDRRRVRHAIKAAGRSALGALASPTNWAYRPDWWWSVVAMNRCNIWRALWKQGTADGRWPLSIETDAVWLPGLDEPSMFKLGDKLGQWKNKGER